MTSPRPRATPPTGNRPARPSRVRGEIGEIDVLVNNAGAMLDMRLRQMGYAEWSAVLRSNLDTLFNTTKQVVDGMADRGWGRIINIGSVAAEKGQIGQVSYATAKGAAIGFTRSLAQEVAARGVTVNLVSPGFIADDTVKPFRRRCWTASWKACRSAGWARRRTWRGCAPGWPRTRRPS